MKLYKAINEQVPTYSEEELLLMENKILRDELEFQENMRSLELMETVLNCIQQEGEVSKSVEIMFGDSVEDKASFKAELEAAYEVFIKDKFDLNSEIDKLVKVANMFQDKCKQAKAYLEENFTRIEYPITCKVFKGGPTLMRYLTEQLDELTTKMESKGVNSMTREECRACVLEFIKFGRDATKDFNDKFHNKVIVEHGSFKTKADAAQMVDRDLTDNTKGFFLVIDRLKGMIQKFRLIAQKAETNSADKYVAQFARGLFFMVRQEAYIQLQCISSLYANMRARTKA